MLKVNEGRRGKVNRILSLLLLVLSGVPSSLAQSKAKPDQRPNKTDAELMQLERDIGDANVRRDKAFFERIEADEFVFTDSAGGLTTKAEDVASLDKPAGEFKLVSYEPDDMKVRVYGKTAVVTGRTTTKLQSKDREVINRSRFTDVFVKRDGSWSRATPHDCVSKINDQLCVNAQIVLVKTISPNTATQNVTL